MKALLDFIPLIAFFVVFKLFGIIASATALLIATLLVTVIHLMRQKGKLDKQQWVVLILTVVFCGLTLYLHDERFLLWKSTVINAIFALVLIVSIAIGKPLLKPMMKDVFQLNQSGWNKLTLAWVGYFILMAGVQYYFAFHTSKETWSNFKFYGWIPFMLVFLVGQFVFLKNHLNPELAEQAKKQPQDSKSSNDIEK